MVSQLCIWIRSLWISNSTAWPNKPPPLGGFPDVHEGVDELHLFLSDSVPLRAECVRSSLFPHLSMRNTSNLKKWCTWSCGAEYNGPWALAAVRTSEFFIFLAVTHSCRPTVRGRTGMAFLPCQLQQTGVYGYPASRPVPGLFPA